MKNIPPIFVHMDRFLFNLIGRIMENAHYDQFLNFLADKVPENKQGMARWAVVTTITMIPILITFIFFLSAASTSSQLSEFEEIQDIIGDISSLNSQIDGLAKNYAGQTTINDTTALQILFSKEIQSRNINIQSISVTRFDNSIKKGRYNEVNASIDIKGISSEDLSTLLGNIIEREKFHIIEFNIVRNNEQKVLDLDFSLKGISL